MKKKWISALVCMAMALSLLPVSAFAEDGEATAAATGATEQEDSEIGSSDAEQIVSEGGGAEVLDKEYVVHGSETETANDRDVTNTGLELGTTDYPLPKEQTVYVAGGGTITFIPAEGTANAKLVLNNAEIDQRNWGRGSAIFFENNVDIEINGTNEFLALNGIISNGTINISGNGTLTVESEGYAVLANKDVVVNSGTLVLSGENGIYADGETDDETGEISGGNVIIHGGAVNVDVDYYAISAYNNVEIGGSANVTATSTGDNDGIYASEGNININGNAKVTATGSCCGIHASEGNVNIGDAVKVIAISDDDGIYASEGNININGNATVTATGDDDGIYTSEGNVNINGNARVTVTGNECGICVSEGNVSIAESAEVTATGDKGIYAGTYKTEDTNEDEGSIIISGSAQVTATGNDDVAIYAEKALEINNNAVVTADGAENKVDVSASVSVSDSAKLNALVQTDDDYIAYGICDTNNKKSIDIYDDDKLEVKPGAEFTINAGTGMDISDIENLTVEGKLIIEGSLQVGISDTTKELPKGKITNNGQLVIITDAYDNAEEVIQSMGLTGTGFVIASPDPKSYDQVAYTNTGEKLNPTPVINLSDDELKGNLDEDGYHWDKENKILILKDVLATGIIDGLTDDVTIQTKGYVIIGGIQNSAGGKITVTGDSAAIMIIENRGEIIFKDTTAKVYYIRAYQEPLAQTSDDSDNADNGAEYSNSVTLINSKVTVGGVEGSEICADKLTMDDNSVLTLKDAEIRCDTELGLEGIKAYLPKDGGYKIGTYAYGNNEPFYTILDSNGNIVRDITLKKAETTKPGGSSGGGGSSVKSYDVTVKAAENGKVETSKKSASKNTTITLTVTADEGYQMDKLTVLDSKNGTIALTDQNNGKFEFKMPDGNVTVEATFVKKAVEEEKPTGEKPETKAFADVSANAWFKKAVDYVNGKGLMSGVDENNFGPELLTNRAMLVTILWRMEGCPTSEQATTFTDIKATDYFYNAVLWAAENKIVSGVSETSFAPNDSITREQLAAILYRYAAYKGYDVTQGGMAVREFSDYEKISRYARSSVAWAVNAGIVSGKGNNTLDPSGVATRAEVASMLMRFCENIAK